MEECSFKVEMAEGDFKELLRESGVSMLPLRATIQQRAEGDGGTESREARSRGCRLRLCCVEEPVEDAAASTAWRSLDWCELGQKSSGCTLTVCLLYGKSDQDIDVCVVNSQAEENCNFTCVCFIDAFRHMSTGTEPARLQSKCIVWRRRLCAGCGIFIFGIIYMFGQNN